MPYTSILKILLRNDDQPNDLPAEETVANNKAERQSLYRGRFPSKSDRPPAIHPKVKACSKKVSSEVSQTSPKDIKVDGKTVVELEADKDFMKQFEASCTELEKRHGHKGGNTTIVHIPETVMESIRRTDSGSPKASPHHHHTWSLHDLFHNALFLGKEKGENVVEMPEHPTPERIKWERQVRKFKSQLPRFGDSEPLERFKWREIENASNSISQQEQQQNSPIQESENEMQEEQLPSTKNNNDDNTSSTGETQAEFRARFEALGPNGRNALFYKHKKKQNVLDRKTLVFNASFHILAYKEISCTRLYKESRKSGGLMGGHNKWNTLRPILPSPLRQSITGMENSTLVSTQLSNHDHENENENEDKILLLRLCFCGACGNWEFKKLSQEVRSTVFKCSTCSKDQIFDVPSNETDEGNPSQQLYSTSTATRLRSSSFGRKISTSPMFLPSPEEKAKAIAVVDKELKKYEKREKKKRERENEGEVFYIRGGNKNKENQCWARGNNIQKSVAARQADYLARFGELTFEKKKLKEAREKLVAMLKSRVLSGNGNA